MYIHICPDDKYIDFFSKTVLEVAGDKEHIFLVRNAKPWKYLKGNVDYIEAPTGSDVYNRYVNNAQKGDFIFLQFIDLDTRDWLANFETEAQIGWVYWGNDFYSNFLSDYHHYDPLTQAYVDSLIPNKLSKYWLLSQYRLWKRDRREAAYRINFDALAKKAASKISYVFHFMKGDFDLIKQKLDCPAEFVYFHFAQEVELEELLKAVSEHGKPLENISYPKKIWVGNCGYPWANHLDSFELIKKVGDDVAICTPLSYGEPNYTKKVMQTGKNMFGERYFPFVEYTDIFSFANILDQMDISIQGHNTPWAMGNITMLQYFGKRVYIKPHIPSYRWLKERNIHIDDYYQFDPVKCFEPLPETVTVLNRNMIDQEFSLEDSKRLIKHMFEI